MINIPFGLSTHAWSILHRPIQTAFPRRPSPRVHAEASTSGATITQLPGKAWLVGCGPGPLDYLTLKAARLIREADVILYDDLGTQAAVKEFAAESAVTKYVGKRGAAKAFPQADIDRMLVDYCLLGMRVVRLKGGCPSVFSRSSSELGALAAAGVEAELVPGICSALAAPLFAGFPLTDRELSRSFAVVSAHAPGEVDWAAHRGIDTLVLLMAGATLRESMGCMLDARWPESTPAALVRSAGLPDQAMWHATLGTLANATADAGKLSPCVVIIGQVASAEPCRSLGSAVDPGASVVMEDGDFLEGWLSETNRAVVHGDLSVPDKESLLYGAYRIACKREGLQPVKGQRFASMLRRFLRDLDLY